MAKLVFPNILSRAYAENMAVFRNNFRFMARTLERSPNMLADMRRQMAVLGNIVGISLANAVNVTVRNFTASKTVVGLSVVSGGVLTSVDLQGSAAIITNSQALTGVTPTGTFVTTVTFTVSGGLITAIALS
jgi:hypothetical protein